MGTNKEMLQKAFEQFRDVIDDYIITEIDSQNDLKQKLEAAKAEIAQFKEIRDRLVKERDALKKECEGLKARPIADPVKDEVKTINVNIDDETAKAISKEIKDMLDSLGNGDSFFNKLLKGF